MGAQFCALALLSFSITLHKADRYVQLVCIGTSPPAACCMLRTVLSATRLDSMVPTKAPARSDALRNREAILTAARGLFAESTDVAMCEVARRAGVGQATLYRNFADRTVLASALLSERLEREERLAAEHEDDPDAFFVLLRSLVETLACFHAIGEL